MAIFFGIVILVLVLVFGIASMMQSYASAQQAEAVIETAQTAQMATFANVVVIVVMSLILLAILAGIVYVIVRLNAKTTRRIERRRDPLERGRRYGEQLKQLRAEGEAKPSTLGAPSEDAFPLVIADDDEVDDFMDALLKDRW